MTTIVILAVCTCALAWFVSRAHSGARARKIAGVRLRIVARLSSRSSRTSLSRALVGLLAGIVFGGTTLGVAGIAAGLASEPLMRSRALRAEVRKIEEQLPDVLRSIAAALRAGRSLPQALVAAHDAAPSPARAALSEGIRRIEVGGDIDDALDRVAVRAGSPEARIAMETIRVGRAAGANLPNILDVLVGSLSERVVIARDRRAATSQGRLSAAVVGGLPLVFLFMVGGPQQRAVLFHDPIGWVLLGAGISIDAAGVLWMRSLTRSR